MLRIFILLASLFFCYPSHSLTYYDKWNFEARDTSCFLWHHGKAKLSETREIRFTITFGYFSKEHVFLDVLTEAGMKNQQYTLTISGDVVDISVVDLGGKGEKSFINDNEYQKLPLSTSIDSIDIATSYTDEDDLQWNYFIQGSVVKNIIKQNLESNEIDFLVGLEGANNQVKAIVSNNGFAMKAYLLKKCEVYFV